MEEYLPNTIVVAVVTLALSYLGKMARKPVQPSKSGQFVLRLNKMYLYVGWLGAIIGLVCMIGVLFSDDDAKLLLVVLFFVIFIPTSGVCMLWYKNHITVFDQETLTVQNWLGKSKTVQWKDIQYVKFKPLSGYIRLQDDLGRKVNIHMHISGLSNLLDAIEQQTPFKRNDIGLPS